MKMLWRKMFYFLLFLCLPAFFLQLLMIHGPSTKNSENLLKAVSAECSEHFKNPFIIKKLSRILAKGDPDEFMKIIQKLLPACQLHITNLYTHNGYGLIDPLASVMLPFNIDSYNFTNVTKMEILKNISVPIKSLCPRQSPLLQGLIEIDLLDQPELRKVNGRYQNWPMTFEELAATYPDLQVGGFYPGPKNCRCRGYNAIIVPYRDREEHLRYFLYYIHQLLQRQQLCYVVIVSEQDDEETFNKGQLMNTAFNYARELMSFDCYIFHDVDIIAEDDRILYTCRDDKIMHIAPFIDKFEYKFVIGLTVGAAVGFTEEQFVAVNGYSNEYAGWGGEDDDMDARIQSKKIPVQRTEEEYSKFKMIKHGQDVGNNVNQLRYQRLKQTGPRQIFEGLSSLDTVLSENILYKTHTRLKVKTYSTGFQRDLLKEDQKKKNKNNVKVRVVPKSPKTNEAANEPKKN